MGIFLIFFGFLFTTILEVGCWIPCQNICYRSEIVLPNSLASFGLFERLSVMGERLSQSSPTGLLMGARFCLCVLSDGIENELFFTSLQAAALFICQRFRLLFPSKLQAGLTSRCLEKTRGWRMMKEIIFLIFLFPLLYGTFNDPGLCTLWCLCSLGLVCWDGFLTVAHTWTLGLELRVIVYCWHCSIDS